MSELIEIRAANRWKLMATVSAAALLAHLHANEARAEDTDRPTVWIELGGQLEAINGMKDVYAAPFIVNHLNAPYNLESPLNEGQVGSAFGGEGKISFQPTGSDWILSAAVRYGRSNSKKNLHQQSTTQYRIKTGKYNKYHGYVNIPITRVSDMQATHRETHAIMDFTAGKDVGLGMFGHGSSSVLTAGVRIAQFRSQSNVAFKSLPDPHWGTIAPTTGNTQYHHHTYLASANIIHSFKGIGPTVSWDAAAAMVGNRADGEVTVDWGVNLAVLFGRQKVSGSHHTTGRYFKGAHYSQVLSNTPLDRRRTVAVPNVGGFAGLSVRYPNAKLSLGYRADFFFNAMDQGVDTRDAKNISFHGPFATVSIGLGG